MFVVEFVVVASATESISTSFWNAKLRSGTPITRIIELVVSTSDYVCLNIVQRITRIIELQQIALSTTGCA